MIIEKVDDKLRRKWITPEQLARRDEIVSGTSDKKAQYRSSCYEVMVHKLCNEKCFFCSQDHASRTTDIKPDDMDIYNRILYGAKKWYGMLGFTGGEPLVHPHILKYIRFWRKAGFNFVRVQTNGVMLGKPGFAEDCIDAGATLFKLSIHHCKAEVHDWLVWLPGAFDKVMKGIDTIRARWGRIGINVVLTEQNYRDLPEILLFFLEKGITTFVVIFPLYENSMKDEAKRVGFRFTDATPYVIKSLLIFDRLGLKRPLILNLPMCLLPGYENAIIQTFNWTAVLNLDGSKTNIDDNKAWGKKRVPTCKDCVHNKICFWVDEEYLACHGASEFDEALVETDHGFDLSDVPLRNYFSEDEECFLELLKRKSPLMIEDIMAMKDEVQICKDCDSMNKIISTAEILIRKGFISKKMEEGKILYSKTKSLWA